MALLVQTLRNLIGIFLWLLLTPITVYVCGRTIAYHFEWLDETAWIVCAIVVAIIGVGVSPSPKTTRFACPSQCDQG